MNSREQFEELCRRWLVDACKPLRGAEDPEPTLLLDTADARAAGGLEVVRLGGVMQRNGFDFVFYMFVPGAILHSRADRWACCWAQWFRVEPSEGRNTPEEASERYARDMYLLDEEVIKPPSAHPDRVEVFSLWGGAPEDEWSTVFKVEREDAQPPALELWEEASGTDGVLAGRMVEPSRQAVRMVAEGEVTDDMVDTMRRYVERVKENVADARRVFSDG